MVKKIKVKKVENKLYFSGNLNLYSVMSFFRLSKKYLDKITVIDLKEVQSTDSVGLVLLFELIKVYPQKEQRLSFSHLPDNLLMIAKSARLDALLNKYLVS